MCSVYGCVYVCVCVWGGGGLGGSQALLMQPTAVLWLEVLVLMDLNLLPFSLVVAAVYGLNVWKYAIIVFGRLNFFSCRRKYILCCAFLMRELMSSSHLRSWEMMELSCFMKDKLSSLLSIRS